MDNFPYDIAAHTAVLPFQALYARVTDNMVAFPYVENLVTLRYVADRASKVFAVPIELLKRDCLWVKNTAFYLLKLLFEAWISTHQVLQLLYLHLFLSNLTNSLPVGR